MLPVMDIAENFMPRTTALEDGGTISYLLPANGRYSTAFKVETAAGTSDNISDINFSELYYIEVLILYLRK